MGTVVALPKRRKAPTPDILQLKIELAWIKPVIWRRLIVPESITLAKLHQVFQTVMGWYDCHLHEFDFQGERYGIPDPDFGWGDQPLPEQRVRLKTALGGARSFRYTYDFGDDWEHKVKLERRLPYDPELARTAFCVAGANACPPEDVGSVPGYEDFVAAMADPNHPEHDEMLAWYGRPYDPAAFDTSDINLSLSNFRL